MEITRGYGIHGFGGPWIGIKTIIKLGWMNGINIGILGLNTGKRKMVINQKQKRIQKLHSLLYLQRLMMILYQQKLFQPSSIVKLFHQN
jgi:hypothetical protein